MIGEWINESSVLAGHESLPANNGVAEMNVVVWDRLWHNAD
jgi:hypothetical protein